MKHFVVTVAFPSGSPGCPLARRRSEPLYVKYRNRDIGERALRRSISPISTIGAAEERSSGFFHTLFPPGNGSSEQRQRLFQRRCRTISGLVPEGSRVIVGCRTDYIPPDGSCVIRAYICVPYADRLANCSGTLKTYEGVAGRMISGANSACAVYHWRFTRYVHSSPGGRHSAACRILLDLNGAAQALSDYICLCRVNEKENREVRSE